MVDIIENPSSLYLGRVVGTGVTKKGENAVVYAVSGRSEGSRQRKLVIENNDTIRMASLTDPTPEQLEKKDIFFYPAIMVKYALPVDLQFLDSVPRTAYRAIVSNGIQTKKISENFDSKKSDLHNPLVNVSLSLVQLGYEEDDYNTPRIAGVSSPKGFDVLGIINEDGLTSTTILKRNKSKKLFKWISTYVGGFDSDKEEYSVILPDYEHLLPRGLEMEGKDAQELADEFYEWMNQKLVVGTGAAIIKKDGMWKVAVKNLHD